MSHFFFSLNSVLRRRRRNNQFVIPPHPIMPCWSTSAMPFFTLVSAEEEE
jgi:hypothetical protein